MLKILVSRVQFPEAAICKCICYIDLQAKTDKANGHTVAMQKITMRKSVEKAFFQGSFLWLCEGIICTKEAAFIMPNW
ncbi:MAG: hypothetical protein Ta2B_08230 [Termitinemataceae bacterium]|nr:MAG: hypothetical protein Ta2B_08230 [Termitinemataceae bacterium]